MKGKPAWVLLFAALLGAAPGRPGQAQDWSWLLSYGGKTTADVVSDQRWRDLVRRKLPNPRYGLLYYNDSLWESLGEVLGGPPEGVRIKDGRYVILSACRLHSCEEKGFAWVDVSSRKMSVALTHYVFRGRVKLDEPSLLVVSQDYDIQTLPEDFRRELRDWIRRQGLTVRQTRILARGRLGELALSP